MATPPSTTFNVQTLSNAIAVFTQALQSASVAPNPNQANPSSTGANPAGSGGSANSERRACQILPSYLKRKSQGGAGKAKKVKAIQTWDRDIICLPMSSKKSGSNISYPRGKFRTDLGSLGLIGKVHLTSMMSEEDVRNEVRSVFRDPMEGKPNFPFTFLQPTGCGSKSLTIPAVSASFEWTAQQVAKLGGNKGTIYILAEEKLNVQDIEVDSDESDEDEAVESVRANNKTEGGSGGGHNSQLRNTNKPTDSEQAYREYVEMIDLTGCESEGDGSGSEIDELPQPAIALERLESSSSEAVKHDIISTKHILKQHQLRAISARDDEDFQRLHVRRACLFNDAFRGFSKPTFNASKPLKVSFIGEHAVDSGGPRREFYRHLIPEIATKSGLFAGWPEHVVPLHNIDAVATNKYYVVGKMLASCLVQGGQPPVCFAHAVADYLVYDQVRSNPCIEDIPDYEVQQFMLQVKEATTTEELKNLLQKEEADFRFTSGYTKPTAKVDISEKENIIRTIWLHYVFFRPHCELEQLRKGFRETLQVELLVCLHPEKIHGLLATSTSYDITPEFFLEEFAIHYSDPGCNYRTKEEAVILHWSEFVMDCKDGRFGVALCDILQFMSGASRMPGAGFECTPSLHFMDAMRLPSSSTCDLSITFPRSYSQLSYDDFKTKMYEAIFGSCGFGSA